jgi:hypothetical protein
VAIKLFTLSDVTVTTAGTRVQITATDTPVSSVIFTAPAANAGKIFIGDSSVSSSRGIEVAAGSSVTINEDNSGRKGDEFILSDFYVDAATSGDKVKVSYVKRR